MATNRHSKAEPLLRQALAIDEKSFGPDHPTVAIRLNNLSQLLEATNRFSEAELPSGRGLVILRQIFPLNGVRASGFKDYFLQSPQPNKPESAQ